MIVQRGSWNLPIHDMSEKYCNPQPVFHVAADIFLYYIFP
jgi:hypothetical protein